MKSLVLYESKYGNTHKVADAIAEGIGGKICCVSDFNPTMLADVELLVVGSPIHGWQPSEDTGQFLTHLDREVLKGKYVATFDTGFKSILSGNAASKILTKLKRAGGRQLMATEKFVVEKAEGPLAPGELDRAKAWASSLQSEYNRIAHPAPHFV